MSEPTIPGYTIVERIGSGGFASVYRAVDDATDTEWAIKVLHEHTSSADDLRRFDRERTTMRALSGHENIVSVNDDGQTEDGRQYTILEYVRDGSVRDRLASRGALHWSEVLSIAAQICAALDVAHRNGVLHRDVKPANILLQGETAKLTDFGIARLIGQSQVTAAQSIVGTLAYTPPEVFHNQPFDGRGDIYQLGITMYEMLLGRAPFTSAAADNKATVIRRILDNPAPPLAQFDVPEPVSKLLDDVLAKDPADRPQSADSLRQRINDVEVELGRTPTVTATLDPTVTVQTELPEATSGEVLPPIEKVEIGSPSVPETTPPPDADLTVVEPAPAATTTVLGPSEAASSDPWSLLKEEPDPAPLPQDRPATAPPVAPPKRRRGAWIGAGVVLLALAGGAGGAWYASQQGDDGGIVSDDSVDDDNGDGDQEPEEPVRTPEFLALDETPFIAPGTSTGIVFGAASNSRGLTMVGAAGDGEGVGSQSAQMWTLDERVTRHQPNFPAAENASTTRQRLWDIGVIDGEQFLAVGDAASGASTNGIAWFGIQMGDFESVRDASFTGSGDDTLRSVAQDGPTAFLVAGRRTNNGASVPGLWQVQRGADGWTSSTWEVIDVGDNPGLLSGVAVSGDIAVAVGEEELGDGPAGVVKIRRGASWDELISPIADARFFGVTISGDRIIAVGDLGEGTERQPIAIVASPSGEGFVHNLPKRGSSGIARDVLTTSDFGVIVVGDDVGRGESTERDGAVWQLLPSEELNGDRWTTRASTDLQASGFAELWAIEEYEDQLYVFGRTESNDARPAGGWALNLAES